MEPVELFELAGLFGSFRWGSSGLFDSGNQIRARRGWILAPISFNHFHGILNRKPHNCLGLIYPTGMLESIDLRGTKFAQRLGPSRGTVLTEWRRLCIPVHRPNQGCNNQERTQGCKDIGTN